MATNSTPDYAVLEVEARRTDHVLGMWVYPTVVLDLITRAREADGLRNERDELRRSRDYQKDRAVKARAGAVAQHEGLEALHKTIASLRELLREAEPILKFHAPNLGAKITAALDDSRATKGEGI